MAEQVEFYHFFVLHESGNFHFHRMCCLHQARSFARWAFILSQRANSVTQATLDALLKKRVFSGAGSFADLARDRFWAHLFSRAATLGAADFSLSLNLRGELRLLNALLKSYFYFSFDIFAVKVYSLFFRIISSFFISSLIAFALGWPPICFFLFFLFLVLRM